MGLAVSALTLRVLCPTTTTTTTHDKSTIDPHYLCDRDRISFPINEETQMTLCYYLSDSRLPRWRTWNLNCSDAYCPSQPYHPLQPVRPSGWYHSYLYIYLNNSIITNLIPNSGIPAIINEKLTMHKTTWLRFPRQTCGCSSPNMTDETHLICMRKPRPDFSSSSRILYWRSHSMSLPLRA
ncbi:hypothetical protein BO70DRAFT_80397 [Aspergillus heteromorphus CBS 117.55]|uniref:Uncharacterized protein n=1 Tax=Aspergillus heteromorphus CBS 117.55 TaxID=1448321 RepID=A0A317WWU3_9EURO|nr:uncharacterized protein BO70DRAFT_80397 [Aspergillus heteromorphus CBS 117.55]PWY90864.1 hypothetical protein BO70DRAFT_80397 [Aspergillus heteromorphus CBS 117.55]